MLCFSSKRPKYYQTIPHRHCVIIVILNWTLVIGRAWGTGLVWVSAIILGFKPMLLYSEALEVLMSPSSNVQCR